MALVPVRLTDKNCPTEFSCGDKEIDDFLVEDALEQAKSQMNETTLFFDDDGSEPVAYVTLLADTIDKRKWRDEKELPKGLGEVPYGKWPAVLIGRLGVSKNLQRKDSKYGTQVFNYVLGMTAEVAIGIRFITVDSYESARGFYEKLGFQPTPGSKRKEDGGTLNMFYDVVASGEVPEDEPDGEEATHKEEAAKPQPKTDQGISDRP